MLRKYFGDQAKIIGTDVDLNCKNLEKEVFKSGLASRLTQIFGSNSVKNMTLDVVLDDGGHTMEQQINSLIALFPTLSNGGTYLCEDTHTSYFPAHGGGLNSRSTFLEAIKSMIDEMHAWYHSPLSTIDKSYLANHLYSIGVFDSIVAPEKRKKTHLWCLRAGRTGTSSPPPAMSHIEMRRAFGVTD